MRKLILFILFVLTITISDKAATSAGTIPPSDEPTKIRIAFFGNSITAHGPDPSLDWPWFHGMAATQPDKDYVHQVQLHLAVALGYVPAIEIVSADINYFDSITGITLDRDTTVIEFNPTIVIVAMGDNANVSAPQSEWLRAYQQIVAWTPNARQRFAVGLWNSPPDVREQMVIDAAAETGMIYVPIYDLHITGISDGETHGYHHRGVKWHPGNLGMHLIAERIVNATLNRIWISIALQQKSPDQR